MIGEMKSASYDATTGTVKVILRTSTTVGYPDTSEQYSPYGIMSVPLPDVLVNVDNQARSQNMVTGYNNRIMDENFSINPGEISLYSVNWYNHTHNAGISMQPRNSINKENAVMGQSTNKVLIDIMSLLISVIQYLDEHVHTGVTTGGGNSGPPLDPAPSDTVVSEDKDYIEANKNLAITGTYEPKS
jgi:hypothetical protein